MDDAIVVECQYIPKNEQAALPWLGAAVEGSKEAKVPVTFAATMTSPSAAFSPPLLLLLLPGVWKSSFWVDSDRCNLGIVVVFGGILLCSDRAHLGHVRAKSQACSCRQLIDRASGLQNDFSDSLMGQFSYCAESQPFVFRYVSFSIAIAMFLTSIGVVGGGLLPFSFFPRIGSDRISISAKLPYGAPI